MKLKTIEIDGKTYAEVQDGKPVFAHDDGKEIPFDAPSAMSKISALNGEAKSHRERAEAAEAKAKAFDGIDDPAAAIKALSTIKNLDDKKLVDAGEVEKVKSEVAKVYEGKLSESQAALAKIQGQLHEQLVGGSFARSKFIAEKFAAEGPAGVEIAQALFGSRMKVEDGKVVAYDGHGNKVFSRARPGDLADFEEAIEALVESYPHKAHILKSSGASGSGAQGGGQGTGHNVSNKKASDMTTAEKAKFVGEHGLQKWQEKVTADYAP